ncbi:MAG: hypothetical protein R2748_23815 [Bryobacterales bacterium]
MEVQLSAEQQAQLAKLAAERGSDEASVASEILGRALDYETWFIREVEKGMQSLDRGEFVEHEELKARIERRLNRK